MGAAARFREYTARHHGRAVQACGLAMHAFMKRLPARFAEGCASRQSPSLASGADLGPTEWRLE